MAKMKPAAKIVLIIAVVAPTIFGAQYLMNTEWFKAKFPEKPVAEVTQRETPPANPSPEEALEQANQAVKAANDAAPKAAPEPSRELDASESRGMKFLLNQGK